MALSSVALLSTGYALTALAESIGQLLVLQDLMLWNNQITELPVSIGQLVALQTLTLSEYQLTALPESTRQPVALQGLGPREQSAFRFLRLPPQQYLFGHIPDYRERGEQQQVH